MITQTPIYKEKVYISGPVTGYDIEERKLAFLKTKHMLESLGYEAYNPLENGLAEDASWQEHLRTDIAQLLQCESIYMMPGWELSHGCKLELDVATSCGIRLMLESQHV